MKFEKLFVFAKAQVSAFLGGIADYFLMIYITEVFDVHYVLSIAIGGFAGSVINFTLNKAWAFRSKKRPYNHSMSKQMLKFLFVVINSILLKASGTHFFTSFLNTDYKISRIITDLTVSLAFNYVLQKNWVFKKETIPQTIDMMEYEEVKPRE